MAPARPGGGHPVWAARRSAAPGPSEPFPIAPSPTCRGTTGVPLHPSPGNAPHTTPERGVATHVPNWHHQRHSANRLARSRPPSRPSRPTAGPSATARRRARRAAPHRRPGRQPRGRRTGGEAGSGAGRVRPRGPARRALRHHERQQLHRRLRGGQRQRRQRRTYWESANNAFPQWIQVDLGAAVSVNRVVLKLPPASAGRPVPRRCRPGQHQRLVLRHPDGVRVGYTFDPATGNTVTISFTAATTRYLRLHITGNTGWPAGQLSELEVYGAGGSGDTQAPSAPGNLAYTQPATGQIRLTWTASTDNVGVTGYDVYANGVLRDQRRRQRARRTPTASRTPPPSPTTCGPRTRPATSRRTATPSPAPAPARRPAPTWRSASRSPPPATSHLRRRQRQRQRRRHLLGGQRRYPSTLTVQLGANADLSSVVRQAQPGPRLGHAYPDHPGARAGSRARRPSPAWSARADVHLQPGHRQHGDHPGHRRRPPTSGSPSPPTPARPAARSAEFQVIGTPAPNPDLTVTGISCRPPRRSRPTPITLSATVRNAGTGGLRRHQRQLLPRHHQGRHRRRRRPRGRRVDHRLARASAPATRAATRSAPRSTRPTRSSSRTTTNNSYTNPTPAGGRAGRRAPTWSPRAVAWSPGNPSAGNTVTFSVAIKNQGTRRLGGRRARHHADRARRDRAPWSRRSPAPTPARSPPGPPPVRSAWAPGPRSTASTPSGSVLAVDANELPVKQANNTSDQPALRRPRRQHAVRHVRGRGRRARRRRRGRRPEPDHRRPRR